MRKRSESAKSKSKERGKGAAPVRRVHREKAGESEERFRTIFEESGDGLLIADIETKRFLDANRKICEMLGYGRDELLALGVEEIHPDEALPDVLDHFEKQLRGDIDVARELPVKRKDGSILYADISSRLITLEGRRCMLGAFRDITERTLARVMFERQKAFTAAAVNSLPGIFYVISRERRFLRWNRNFESVSGYSADEIATMSPLDLFEDPDRALIAERIGEVFEKGGSSAEALFKARSGEKTPYFFTGARIELEGQTCCVGTGIDITGLKRTEEALRASEKRYRSALDGMLEGCQIIGRDWRYLYLNDSAVAHARREKKELLGRTMTEAYPGIERTEVFTALRRCMEERTPRRMENEFTYPDGSRAWFELSIQPVPEGIFVSSLDITERKKAELALRQSEERLAAALGAAELGIWDWDMVSGKIVWAGYHAKLFGFGPGEFDGKYETFEERVHPEDREKVKNAIDRSLRERTEYKCDYRSLLPDGTVRWIAGHGHYRWNEKGEPVRMLGAVRDITARKQAEEALRLSEAMLRALFENMSSGVAVYESEDNGRNFVFKDINPAGERISRVRKEEIIGRRVTDVFPSVEDFGLLEVFRKVWETGEPAAHPASFYKDRRVTAWYDNYVYKLPSSEIVAVYRDITEQKCSEEAIRESEERLELALAGARLGTWDWNIQTGEVIFNERWAEMLGYTLDEIEPHVRAWEKLVHPGDMPRVREALNKHLEGRTPFYEAEYRLLTKSGEWKWILDRGKVVERDGGGKPLRAAGTHLDLSERKRLEEQLRHIQKMEAVGTLAGGLAHDFNNILAGIIGYTSLLRKTLKESPLAPDIEAIEKLAWRGADITKGLLTFSRKGEYQPELRNINSIIEEVLKVIGRTSGSHIEIRAELSPDTQNISGDKGQLNQAFMNLCINACDAMPEKGVLTMKTGNADLEEEFFRLHANMKAGPYIFVMISDTGTGMDEETRERIFEPFFTTKDEKSGTGLGLAMVIGIIEGHRGCVEVVSEPGRGSTFTVYLPAAEGEVETEDSEPPGHLRGDETILLADDEEDFRKSVGRALEELGYTIIGAADGEEAVRRLEEKRNEIDIVLLDMVMKGGSGVATFSRMRELVPDLPIILCSGYAIQSATQKLLDRGADGHIQKPFDIDTLALKVRKILDGP